MSPVAPPPVAVSLLALPETTPATFYGLLEVFRAVGSAWTELTGEPAACRRLEVSMVARDTQPYASPVGPPIAPGKALGEVSRADVLIVTDLALAPDFDGSAWAREAAFLREQFDAGAMICSVCTGSLLLAEAGLLDGIEATTHWGAIELLRSRYPKVLLRPERILCPAGPEHRIVTGGGPAAWEDLALYLIARFCGEKEARRICKVFLLGDRSSGQLPFAAMGRSRSHEDAVIGRCQEWLADNYARPSPVATMTASSGLPERSFKRRFKSATGYTPIDYVQALRVEEAKQLLETTHAPVEEIALLVGYEDPTFFRRLFKRRTGVTPARYRQKFQSVTRPPPPTPSAGTQPSDVTAGGVLTPSPPPR